jgi:hypothetical protein
MPGDVLSEGFELALGRQDTKDRRLIHDRLTEKKVLSRQRLIQRHRSDEHQIAARFESMADIEIPQAEADALLAMEKLTLEDDKEWNFPGPGEALTIPLTSTDKRENFNLDITRGRIKLTKATYQNRARQAIVLMRLDLDGPPHRNPDAEEIPCPHLHIYREGYGDKWAMPAPSDRYMNTRDLFATFEAFMRQCNITKVPVIQKGLF